VIYWPWTPIETPKDAERAALQGMVFSLACVCLSAVAIVLAVIA
jgi:hypothetical protein